MTLPPPGSFTISCRASLEFPRDLPDSDEIGVVDALLFSSQPKQQTCMVACSLRYGKTEEDEQFVDGVYDITANVCARFCN